MKIDMEPSDCGLPNGPIISNVPALWNSSSRALSAGKCGGALVSTSSADS